MIDVVGIGLDGVSGLTETVRKVVEEATILVGSNRHLDYFPNHLAKKIVLKDIQQTLIEVQEQLLNQEKIVILVSGDPLFFGLGRLLLEQFPSEILQFHPHLNSVQLAFNRIKVPWHDAQIVSVHGRALDELNQLLQKGVEKIAILTDSVNNPVAIAGFYLSLEITTQYNFWICENLESETEKITQFLAQDLVLKSDNDFAGLNIVILIRQENNHIHLNNLPLFGITDSNFLAFKDRPGLMTKREIRLIILGELSLQEKQIIWDIGAGTGSVSIEIARLCTSSQIYAIEKTAIGINLIEQNCQRFKVTNVNPIYGIAPNILENLPSPHRIFLGGSSGKLDTILSFCSQKLENKGIIVLALATLENIHQSLLWFNENNWQYKLLQVQISRSTTVGELTRFSPLNPVTIITAHQL
ncbi:precorrin-6y C5,15-methyltransferase (decarboxylating) subunit CbiE [Chroococcus sp. FPU101]|uniref:precorrin-6y C5,15-methyltransferase (decarboxylating) subunit CbiE n=1 Tax=Chroococcus sp. FPU101 TaxID=1974212 RepID=UPI001A8ECE53|nr:precorrin-6y C5,15-methyltransferase (decarboxylating) subunit CbiE [Chroococcus sp. FPU101]GFE68839.1 precorrin-6y C5,15-methyltransferase (decarboxylating), CbiE subunit [Chroococcus sp. FPU101]